MKILIIASDKGGKFAPFVEEQISALQACGVEILRYAITGKGILGYLKELPKLKQYIRTHKPDLLHAHFGLSGLLANLQRMVPVVTTYHGSDINKPSILRFSRIAMRLSAFNIFVSKRNVALAMGYGQWAMGSNMAIRRRGDKAIRRLGKYSLLPCGITIPKPWSELKDQKVEQLTLNQWVQGVWSKDVKHVLFAGAFDNAVKDPQLAKAAMNELEKMGVKAELIELKGYNRDQVNALMYTCHALLMTSKTEGSPQVIKEAMACGCPIVSVDVGDVAERLSEVEGGYVLPTRDSHAIAEALQLALAFEGKTNGREKIIEMGLSNEQVAKQLVEIYQSIVQK